MCMVKTGFISLLLLLRNRRNVHTDVTVLERYTSECSNQMNKSSREIRNLINRSIATAVCNSQLISSQCRTGRSKHLAIVS